MISDAPEPRHPSRLETFCHDLCLADWDDPNAPMRLSPDLSLADVGEAAFFHNARVLLLALRDAGGTPATATGNLTRAFVADMFGRLSIPTLIRRTIERLNKVTNETDVRALHLARVVSECGGLMKLRSKRFTVTQAAAGLLDDDRAGELYRRLFIAFFRKFNLLHLIQFPEVPAIQQSVAVILWRLEQVAQDWRPVEGLAALVLLPRVLQQVRASITSEYQREDLVLGHYVLNPLLNFGLLELKRRSGDEWPGVAENDSLRITPVWRKFFAFRTFEP